MANYNLIMNQIDTDREFYVWGCGQDIKRFNGNGWDYYNYQNSAVPSGAPYFLDTRCISIDPEDRVWVGCAEGPTAGLNEVAVFYIDSNDVSIGESWNFSDLGNFDVPQEISHIYSCPFGDDILAFCTPLNGFGGTGPVDSYTEFKGVTGGRLFYYIIETGQWKENVPGYTWPHIYDITTKGYDGKGYFYYIATNEGLFKIPQGVLDTLDLTDEVKIIKQAQVYNTKTSGIISDNIFSLDLDEDGNLWIGTDSGLSFFDGKDFWNYLTSGPVTKVKARPNGHVFYSVGDGELYQGTGLWHFNGYTHTQYTTSNSALNNNNVIDIKLVENNISQKNLTVYENGLWVLCHNDLVVFNYDQPHVYGSSNYAGATGWNFTYFSSTGSTGAPLPKVNKYTWEYPKWRVYQEDYLKYKFPGIDLRNLFLTTNLSDIASGKAGKQEYWDNWPLESYEESLLSDSISTPSWNSKITVTQNNSDPNYQGHLQITSSTSIETQNGINYYVGGYLKGNISVNFGNFSNDRPAILNNENPTIGGVPVDNSISGLSTLDTGEMGFVVSYNENGSVNSILPFRGYQTRVQDIVAAEDENYLFVSGTFDRFIENGPYVWDSLEGENYSYRNGPTGAPAGVTNPNVPGLTSGEYPWVYGSTGSVIITGTWKYFTGDLGQSKGMFDVGFSSNKWEDIEFIYVNNFDSSLTYINLEKIFTAMPILLRRGSESALYRVDYIENLPNSPKGVKLGVRYNYAYNGSLGSFSYNTNDTFSITVYDYSDGSYPLVREIFSVTADFNMNNFNTSSVFIAKVGRDLGNTISFSNLGQTGGFNSDVAKSYRCFEFRSFPSKYSLDGFYENKKSTKLDVSRYSVNLAITSDPVFGTSQNGGVSTLKNLWNRTGDYIGTDSEILQSNSDIVQNMDSDSIIGYVKMSSDDLSLFSTKTSSTNYLGSGTTPGSRIISGIKSLYNDETSLITGISSRSFNFSGIEFNGISSYTPYYIILDKDGKGLTGGVIQGATGYLPYPKISKDLSSYYITSIFGGSGEYFGTQYIAESTGSHFITARITDQAVPLSMDNFNVSVDPSYLVLLSSDILDNGNRMVSYAELNTPSGDVVSIVKTNGKNKILDTKEFSLDLSNGLDFSISIELDKKNNLAVSAFNYGSTGEGYQIYDSNKGSTFISEQYVPELGINLGNIISRPGSGAWTWCDVHSTDKGMKIPLMTTVIFSNYASNIYGKQNNNWVLKNSITGDVLLDVKETPYFIYTFTSAGNYTIYNSVEDSFGNVYATTKPGYIEVVNHKEKNPDDKNPNLVDSFDYGQPEPFPGRDYQVRKLAKDLMIEQNKILKSDNQQFGSDIDMPDNPDATFRS